MRRRFRAGSWTPAVRVLFTGDDIGEGQAVFLRYGLMDNGSIWGHGAYLGPDYSAEALHRIGRGHRRRRWRSSNTASRSPT